MSPEVPVPGGRGPGGSEQKKFMARVPASVMLSPVPKAPAQERHQTHHALRASTPSPPPLPRGVPPCQFMEKMEASDMYSYTASPHQFSLQA